MNGPSITTIAKAANPGAGDVFVNTLLPNVAIAYFQEQGGLHTTFPMVPVDLQTSVYTTFSRADTMRVKTDIKAPNTGIAQIGFNTDLTNTYTCTVYEAEYAPPAEVVANYSLPMPLDVAATKLLARAAYLRRELNWITSNFTTGIWGTDKTVSVTWDDPSSDPIGDIETGIEVVLLATGQRPNVLAVGYQVWKALKQHPDILQRIGTGSASNVDPRMITPRLVAALFGLDEIKIGEVTYNTAASGASISMAFAAGKNALLCYRAPTPSVITPSAGYMFAWRGLTGSIDGLQVRMGYEMRRDEQWYQIRHAEAFKVTASELGYFFPSCVA